LRTEYPLKAQVLALICAAGVGLVSRVASADSWTLQLIKLESEPVQVYLKDKPKGLKRVYVRTKDNQWFRFNPCPDDWCLEKKNFKPKSDYVPRGAIPDAVISKGKINIRAAWLTEPTRRYSHGVLGDNIEAGGLNIKNKTQDIISFSLDLRSVFEDRFIRLADLDKDGEDEMVVVHSYLTSGAALSVLEYGRGGISMAAETPAIGQRNRWLNPAGIADFDGDGYLEVAIVVTPHIDGRLEFWQYRSKGLLRKMQLKGFSNHFIGSRIQNMSAVADFDGDGIADLALPNADRTAIRVISFADGKVAEPVNMKLPAQIVTEMITVKPFGENRNAIIVGLKNGQVALVRYKDDLKKTEKSIFFR